MSVQRLSNVSLLSPGLAVATDFKSLLTGLPGLISWVSASEQYVVKDDAGRVSKMVGRVGSGFSKMAGIDLPLYVDDQISGFPAVRFDAAEINGLAFDGDFPAGADSVYTKVIIFKYSDNLLPSVNGNIMSSSNTRGHGIYIDDTDRQNVQSGGVNNALILSGRLPDQWICMIVQHDDAAGKLKRWVSGFEVLSDTAALPNSQSDCYFGVGTAGGSAAGNFDLAEAFISASALIDDVSSFDIIKRYLVAKYGLAV